MKRFLATLIILCLTLGLTSVSVWASETSEWQTETILEGTERHCSAVTSVGDDIYIISGYLNTALKKDVDIYNIKTKKWRKGTPIPVAVDSPAVCTVKNKIYLFANKLVQIYDTKTDSWTNGVAMPVSALGSVAAMVNGKIYIISGRGNNRLDIYDIETNIWSSGAPIPIAVDRGTANVIGNHIYVIGGLVKITADGSTNALQIYDVETNQWTSGQPMPTKRAFPMSSVVGDNIYVMGGAMGASGFIPNNILKTVEIYNTTTNSWTPGPSLSKERANVRSSVLIDGKIYLAAGFANTIEYLQVTDSSDNSPTKLSVLLNVDEQVQLSTLYDLENNKNFIWTSTKESVATVDSNGKVTAIGTGESDIYAESEDGTFKEYIPVKVVEGIADELRLAVHLKSGEKAKLYLIDDSSQVAWTSMDDSVVTVSADGHMTGVKKGLAIVQAELGGETYQIYVRVNG